MNGFLLDTHVWLWQLNANPAMPRTLWRFLDAKRSDCWLSPISIWEIALLAKKKRIVIEPDVHAWMAEALRKIPLREAALTFEVAQRAELLAIGDPADTLIAATAMTYDLTLVTVDRRLRRVKGLRTLGR